MAPGLRAALAVRELVAVPVAAFASSVAAACKGEADIAVGNIIGSNLFNTLVVVGLAGAIVPIGHVPEAVLARDVPVSAAFTLTLFLFGAVPLLRRRPASLRRWQGAVLLLGYLAYTAWLVRAEAGAA